MKTKFFFIYVFVGIAFLGACLWVFLTGGKNAKAVNAKYRLGGIVLTAWAVMSVVSCDLPNIVGGEGGNGMVMCYDPVQPDYPIISIKAVNSQQKMDEMTPGDTIRIEIEGSSRDKYLLEVRTGATYDGTGDLLQREELVKEKQAVFEVVLSKEIEYKGPATILVLDDEDDIFIRGQSIVTII